jgi:hypothetical protein
MLHLKPPAALTYKPYKLQLPHNQDIFKEKKRKNSHPPKKTKKDIWLYKEEEKPPCCSFFVNVPTPVNDVRKIFVISHKQERKK